MFPKTPHFAVPPEAEIRTTAINLYLPNQHPSRVPDIYAISAPAVYVSEHVTLDAIRRSRVGIGKYSAVGQVGRIVFPEHRVCVDGGSATVVGAAVAVNEVSVGDVDSGFIWRETDPIWPTETVRYHSYIACAGVKAVNELRELWFGSETLFIAVDWVREPDGAIRVDSDVIWRIERA